jgi:hypothetical protein
MPDSLWRNSAAFVLRSRYGQTEMEGETPLNVGLPPGSVVTSVQ